MDKTKSKILLIEGNKISLDIKCQSGILEFSDIPTIRTNNIQLILSNVTNIEIKSHMNLGTYIEITNNNKYFIITVPRLFLNIGNGYAIINKLATKKLYKLLLDIYA